MTYPIVYIEWRDAFAGYNWAPVEVAEQTEPSPCNSVGFLIADEEGHITLANSVSEDDVNGFIVIPTGMITKRVQLRKGTG